MSLFGASRPKGITKDELQFIRGELRSPATGEKLSDSQLDQLMELLEMNLDADSGVEMQNHWEQINATEAMQVEQKIANNKGTHFSPGQIKHIHSVLQKYIDINKVKSLF